MRIEDKFKKAGMEDVYDGVYRFISNETHNMITLLRGRQLDLNADVPFIRGFRKWSYKELLPFVDAVVATLYSSSVNLLTALSRPLPSELEKVPEKIKIFRDAALDAPQR
ncbi:MAG: hypothetical protein CVV45_08710 [Spirochaetae bacterium HGW-Spirochaetae-10]|nr:MAG: hypothetical protein CVV45_08710 [Spirochaetae bacterium HGW-Spirochaetae-10]